MKLGPHYKLGDKRTYRAFAWWPIGCDDGTTRWLEHVWIEEERSYYIWRLLHVLPEKD